MEKEGEITMRISDGCTYFREQQKGKEGKGRKKKRKASGGVVVVVVW